MKKSKDIDKQKHLDWLAERERLAKIERKEYEGKLSEKILLSLLSNSNYVPSCNRAEIDNVIKKSKEIARVWMNDKDTDD